MAGDTRPLSSSLATGWGGEPCAAWWRGNWRRRLLPLHHRIFVRWLPSPRTPFAGRNCLALIPTPIYLAAALAPAATLVAAKAGSGRGVAQPGRALSSGGRGRRFESSLPDQLLARGIFVGFRAVDPLA